MRKFVFVPLIVLLLAGLGLASAREYRVSGKAGGYTVNVIFDNSPLEKGNNPVKIAVSDADSRPVTDAKVVVDYSMPTLPGRPSMMSYTATATGNGNTYKAMLDLSMRGEWTFVINVTRAGKTDAMTFNLIVK
jgi:hypothetical protein